MKRYLRRVAPALLSLCVVLCGCAHKPAPAESSGGSAEPVAEAGYEDTLFDASRVHDIDVRISEEDRAEQLADPVQKKKYKVDVTIDGEELKDVSFATKGNSSLYFVAYDTESDRYSYKLNFGKYAKGQTYRGLDKLCLNNSFRDAAYLKDHVSYEIFRQAGVPAPLTSFVRLTVNGEDAGLYLAVEDIGDAFLGRAFGGEGVIYKPESEELGLTLDKIRDIMENGLPMTKEPHGADLVYRDDDPASYPDIFEHAETRADESDTRLVIAALKRLAEGSGLDECLDTDGIIRFFAAHNFVMNYDSYTGAMLHNLVLYEREGVLSMLPWDYNLAFCTFVPGVGKAVLKNATDAVNQGIDSPLIGAEESERPMWRWIVDNEDHRGEYHAALDSLLTGYFESGKLAADIDAYREMLLPYVEKDPTAFYTAEDFGKACETLKTFCALRAESVRHQLDGRLATVNSVQRDADKVDASGVSVMDMGAFDAGKE